jgi:KRAB domain-containing zinc finger protein
MGSLENMDQLEDSGYLEKTDVLEKSFVKIETTPNLLQCEQCHKDFSTKYALKRHKKIHIDGEIKKRCSTCNRFFATVEAMEDHCRSAHPDLICHICAKVFKRMCDLNCHIVSCHSLEDDYSNSGINIEYSVCPFEGCQKRFSKNILYQDHLNSHTGKTPYDCSKCGKKFSLRYSLTSHEKKCIEERKYKCDTCEKEFTTSNSLKVHVSAAHTVAIYKCTCNKEFKYQTNLKRHQKVKGHFPL